MLKIGSHVSMSGKEMLLGSVKEAVSYGANTFMFYTGAPQNTARKPVSQLRVEEAKEYMKEHHMCINGDIIGVIVSKAVENGKPVMYLLMSVPIVSDVEQNIV